MDFANEYDRRRVGLPMKQKDEVCDYRLPSNQCWPKHAERRFARAQETHKQTVPLSSLLTCD